MNKRTSLLLAAFAVLVIGGLLAAISTAPHTTSLSKKIDLISQYTNSAGFGQNTILYADSGALATYDYTTGTIQAISPDVGADGLKNIDTLSVSNSKKYVLFHTASVTSGSLLATTLQNNKLNTTQDYWWVYSVDSKTFSPLPTGILMAKIDDSNAYTLAASSAANSETITTYDLTTLKPTTSTPIIPSTNFFATKNGFLLETTDNKTYLTKDGVVNYQVLTGATILGLTSDQGSVISSRANNNELNVQITNLQNRTSQTIATNITGPSWSADQGLLLYYPSSNTSQLATYNITTKKTAKLQLANNVLPSDGSLLTPTVLLDNTTFIATDTKGGIHLIGTNITPANIH